MMEEIEKWLILGMIILGSMAGLKSCEREKKCHEIGGIILEERCIKKESIMEIK